MDASTTSGFTAINGRKPTPPGGYDVLPPNHELPTFDAQLTSALDEVLNDSEFVRSSSFGHDEPDDTGVTRSSTIDNDAPLAKANVIEPSIEDDIDTITLKIATDADDSMIASGSEEDSAYSYLSVKNEALVLFHDEQPDFCVKNSKKEMTRDVRDNSSNEVVQMKFRWWDDDAAYGY